MGAYEIFLVPVGPDGKGMVYEAIFHLEALSPPSDSQLQQSSMSHGAAVRTPEESLHSPRSLECIARTHSSI